MNTVQTQDLSLFHLILNASLVVQLVMGLLFVLSLASWWVIFMKFSVIKKAQQLFDRFETDFWAGQNLTNLYDRVSGGSYEGGTGARLFEAGFREFIKLQKHVSEIDAASMMDSIRRAMRATYQRELDKLDSNVNFLATVGSVSPYVGLFGTVWGIIHAFHGLSNMAQATLAAVAPGIAEALIATAIGLFAAIPAVVAYNRFSHDTDRLAIRYESFMEEFSNVLQRQISKKG